MNSLNNLTPDKLRKAADIQERILDMQRQLNALLSEEVQAPMQAVETGVVSKKGRKLTGKALANVRAGVRKRRVAQGRPLPEAGGSSKPVKKPMSAANAARSAAARARWAKIKAAGRTRW